MTSKTWKEVGDAAAKLCLDRLNAYATEPPTVGSVLF